MGLCQAHSPNLTPLSGSLLWHQAHSLLFTSPCAQGSPAHTPAILGSPLSS